MTQGSLFTAAEVCPLCKRDGGEHVAGCFREPSRPLPPDPPIARTTDPDSSRAAAEAITRSGERQRQTSEVLRLVREHPGRTSLELTRFTDLDRYQVARRLPELEQGLRIRKGEIRACTVGNRPAVTWWEL
jgi:hypothetical protein